MTTPQIEMIAPSELRPYERNARTHPATQRRQIAGSIKEFGFRAPILIDECGEVIAGHARLEAALELGLDKVPCVRCDDMTDDQARAYRLADNRLAMNSDWDRELLNLELKDLHELEGHDWGLAELGFNQKEIDEALSTVEQRYTQKIESPIYEVTGERPAVRDLFDATKANQLQTDIDAAELPQEVADFLRLAATRHTVFDFSAIAEFYAHADAETQNLMERSALVILDYDKAIDQGFIKLAGAVQEEYRAISS